MTVADKPCFLSYTALFVSLLSCYESLSWSSLLLLLPGVQGHGDGDPNACACVAQEHNFTINCTNPDFMLTTFANLITDICDKDCSSDDCRRNYWISQSHHDYCPEHLIPELIEDGLHAFEGACDDCHILRQPDPSLPACPQVDCTTDEGNQAYGKLIEQSCQDNCNTDVTCQENFRIVRAFHDGCPEDSLTLAEQGIHDFEEPCKEKSCNVADPASNQLECKKDDQSGATTSSFSTTLMTMAILMVALVAPVFVL